jgi:hypothetical protein
MRRASTHLLALVSLFSILSPAAICADELETVTNEAAGFAIDVPSGWQAVPLPTGLLVNADESNERGQPVAMINVSRPDLGGKTFSELFAAEQTRAERMTTTGDEHVVTPFEHQAGSAFRALRRTTTRDGQVQMVISVYLDTGNEVWLVNWITPPTDAPERLEDLAATVARSFSLR